MTERQPVALVVDDMLETRRLIRRVLERDSVRVIEAATGEQAVRMVVANRPDVVVLDLRLPGMSGFDVAELIRGHPDPEIARTPLLACSASVQPEVRARVVAVGFDDFEGKPFDVRTFASKVRGLIAHRQTD
jgi:CheY-like chemotaxis protein